MTLGKQTNKSTHIYILGGYFNRPTDELPKLSFRYQASRKTLIYKAQRANDKRKLCKTSCLGEQTKVGNEQLTNC